MTDTLSQTNPQSRWQRLARFVRVHLPVLLYGWFWLGMFLCGLLAPVDRVLHLQSGLITEGWHLSLLSVLFGLPVLVLYWWRMRRP